MIARTSLTRKYLFFFYRISSYKIKRKILLVTWAKATVGDLFRSPTIGDLNFFFFGFLQNKYQPLDMYDNELMAVIFGSCDRLIFENCF